MKDKMNEILSEAKARIAAAANEGELQKNPPMAMVRERRIAAVLVENAWESCCCVPFGCLACDRESLLIRGKAMLPEP